MWTGGAVAGAPVDKRKAIMLGGRINQAIIATYKAIPLGEVDGWKTLTADTDLKTMKGKLIGIKIDASGLVTHIDLPNRGLVGNFNLEVRLSDSRVCFLQGGSHVSQV
jgi:hypothetical protein